MAKPALKPTCAGCRHWTQPGMSGSGRPFGQCDLRHGSTVGAGHTCGTHKPKAEA